MIQNIQDQEELGASSYAEVGREGIPRVGVGNGEFDPLPAGNRAGNGESFRRLKTKLNTCKKLGMIGSRLKKIITGHFIFYYFIIISYRDFNVKLG